MQVIIAQWLAWQLATSEVRGSNIAAYIKIWKKVLSQRISYVLNTFIVWVYERTGLV